MPTSVLLAVLAAAGLLALAPALVRRYDAAERLEAARAQSTARVLPRTRRRRTVPGRRPINPSRMVPVPTLRPASFPVPDDRGSATGQDHDRRERRLGAVSPWSASRASASRVSASRTSVSRGSVSRGSVSRGSASAGSHRSALPRSGGSRSAVPVPRSAPPARRPARPRYSPAIYRRRRILAALVLLNVVELAGVVMVGPGFWVGLAVTGTLLAAYLVHLRGLAVADQRRRRAEARRRAWLAAQQALVRREQERRAAMRRAAARRMAAQRERLRRSAGGWSATVSYRRASGGRS